LLHVDPARRPRHAIQISRMLNAIQGVKPTRGTFDAVDPAMAMRRPSAVNGWQAMQVA
jgi:serine/threonine-protein kinase